MLSGRRRGAFLCRLFLIGTLVFPFFTLEVEASQGVELEPAIQKVYVGKDGLTREPIQKVRIRNTTALELTFSLKAIEFTNIDKNGGNIFIGQSLSEGEFKEATWLNIEESQFLLIPGEEKEINYSLEDTQNLLPGAHYGALLFETVRSENLADEDPARIFLRQIATSLLYVSKEADDKESIRFVKIDAFTKNFGFIESLALTFVNEGNTLVEPRGFISVTNVFNQETERVVLNPSSKILLPGQERQIEARFQKVRYFLPGPYTFNLFFRADDGEYQKVETTYWHWQPIVIIFSILLLMLIGFFAYSHSKRAQSTKKAD